MRRHSRRVAATVTLGIFGLFIAGCSSGSEQGPATSTSQATGTSETVETSETPTAAPGSVEVSPGGVTTAIGAPADSTEDEYFKACESARAWMKQQGGDSKSQLEPYLRNVQSTDAPSPGTFGTPWSQLPPKRQAAVIVAAQAAADELCG
ncbi:lipoprotein LpqV [Mycobacterium sp. 2YAF39]|uniref:lipoprotein LpqV n=1 Tax=Mycobacterium sp. 2YAF39 TaxID=3233033 RepID=UPI003F9C6DFE